MDSSISPDLHERDRRADEGLFQRSPRRQREPGPHGGTRERVDPWRCTRHDLQDRPADCR